MTNILIEAEEYLLSSTFELHKIFKYMAEKYAVHTRLVKQSAITPADFSWCDILITVRSHSSFDVNLSNFAKRQGKLHILVLDDDLLGLPSNYGRYGVGIWPPRKKALKDILDSADMLLTPNPLLGEKYTNIGKMHSYVMVNTAISPQNIKDLSVRTSNEKIKIVYYVNDGFAGTFEHFIQPILPKLAETYKYRLSLTLMALKPRINNSIEDKIDIRHIEHLDFKEFRAFLQTEEFDIGIAPLITDEFSQYKYFNKFIEYTIAGVPGIYSNCIPYTYIIKDGVNGMLCGDSPDDWYNALCKLIDSKLQRENIVRNARKQLKNEFTIEKVVEKLIIDYPMFVSFKAPKGKYNIKIYWLQFCRKIAVCQECYYFARLAFQKGGVRLLSIRIYRYINRLRKSLSTEKKLKNEIV